MLRLNVLVHLPVLYTHTQPSAFFSVNQMEIAIGGVIHCCA